MMADKSRVNKEERALQEIFEDKRSFVMEDGTKFYIESPTADEVRQADWHYSKTYNEAFLAGVTTLAQMEEILEDRKILGPEFEKKREELEITLNEKLAALEAAEDVQVKKELIDQVEAARAALYTHNRKASSPLSNTCEQLVSDARLEYLTAHMIVDESGNRVWSGYEDYKTTDKPGLAIRARYEIMLYLQGYDSDFLEKIPEAIARKELEEAEKAPAVLEEADEEKVKTQKTSKKSSKKKPSK